jgi:phytoene/squalene synthetase
MPLTLTPLGLPPHLQRLLRDTSRSFFLTLQALPQRVRPQIGLAYLLARATDTIADTELVPAAERLAALEALRDRILGTRTERVNLLRLAMAQSGFSSLAERRLLERIEDAIGMLPRLREDDMRDLREVIAVITSGQELDLKRFEEIAEPASNGEGTAAPPPLSAIRPPLEGEPVSSATPVMEAPPVLPPVDLIPEAGVAKVTSVPPLLPPRVSLPPPLPASARRPLEIRALATDTELDDYTYRVAGCVGEFWTKLTRRHCFPKVWLDENQFLADAVRFGKGLQLVNILRDLPRDLRNGRCYLPAERLAAFGLQPAELLDPANAPRLRPLYRELVERAYGHLEAGWRYTNTIPHRHFRLRLACAWPILIGVKTLVKLLAANPLDASRRVKVSRMEVYGIFLGSLGRVTFRGPWRQQFDRALEP